MQDSNLRRHSHQIYSLTPLTARETPLVSCVLLKFASCVVVDSGRLSRSVRRGRRRPDGGAGRIDALPDRPPDTVTESARSC